jgi:SAM-dependent methyltransferase
VTSYVDWKSWRPEDFGRFGRFEAAYYQAELGPWLGTAGRFVLELGFGNGSVLGWLKGQGHRVVGVEAEGELVQRATAAGFSASATLEGLPRGKDTGFDLIVALDVLEHVRSTDLPELLAALRARLRPGAVLLVRFPNGNSPYGRRYQYGDPTHRTVIGTGVLQKLATDAGLELVVVRGATLPLRGVGMIRPVKYAAVRLLRAVHGWFIGHLYFGGEPTVLDPTLVAVLRRPVYPGEA